ncbi:protein ANTHESIS POMOTING FACTOR 1-like isoform X6 [Citrus sinensis]|uniref:protein ANTHESIS POMOTING FACTOR 1-like isoform X6 n=1 Tax=Citrus sinensis TaxID=2711 RepID=UPI0022785642|nr:protein ANTHESIS POMOTING FACTOR 1-like isoform X6 [Citrus sinensis]XP_052297831.1 protein ANTHESIS POMOTING FACTOR 1-like isoform X6 [Citrus sinensis]XP_052297832.1 protein ANTHESIS POMOTING FACTOR 1-like isoform X6 [Citrus sinensis]XP_052297833.1 protein ANTHESIS POMOTING FACTOR 1-like isoform X6 [Citrus sinensis]XP_052297834.1 protein ANTHESIS POMOTING FACTOR 1-like isoform X6 [Citrus sinensis]
MFCNHYYLYICFTASRVVSLGLCSSKDCFIYGSLDRTVLLWDQQAKKCQGLLHVQGRPATAYNDQGRVFAVAFGGYIRLFDARKYEGPFDIFSDGGDVSDANEVKLSNDGRLMLLTTLEGHIHVLHSFQGTLVSLLFLSSSPKCNILYIYIPLYIGISVNELLFAVVFIYPFIMRSQFLTIPHWRHLSARFW